MKKIESDCVQCDLPCIYSACPHYQKTHYYCDECDNEDVLYEFNGEELCKECVLERLVKIN